jgi:hypothetical protein
MKTITEHLRGINPVRVAEQAAGMGRSDPEGIEKEASADDGTPEDIEFDADLGGSGLDPDGLEKLASAVEQVISLFDMVRPDLDIEDILSVEGKRALAGIELRDLGDLPIEKKASAETHSVGREKWGSIVQGLRKLQGGSR